MTKKSHARMQRDIEKKKIKELIDDPKSDLIHWNDLENIYTESGKMILSSKNIAEIYKIPGVVVNTPDKKATIDHIRGLAKDVKYFAEELVKIHNEHKDRSGVVDDADGTIDAIKIYEGYVNWQQEYNSVIIPTVTFLAEQAGLAVDKIAEQSSEEEAKEVKRLLDAQNELSVDVVTDVIDKNIVEQPKEAI